MGNNITRSILGFSETETKRYAYKPYRQPGCKAFCAGEQHMYMNQVWRFREKHPDKLVLFCRECGYATITLSKRCYCCATIMAFANARMNSRRQIYNEKKVRY